MVTFIRRMMVVMVAAAATSTAALVQAHPAMAGNCSVFGTLCGKIHNHTKQAVYIANNWCWSDRDTFSGDSLPCVKSTKLDPGKSSTSKFKDADALRMPGGCTTTYTSAFGPVKNTVHVNRRGKGPFWQKVRDGQTVTITAISC